MVEVRHTVGRVLHTAGGARTVREAVEAAARAGADLRGADLRCADLGGAWRDADPPAGWLVVDGRLTPEPAQPSQSEDR